MGELLGPPLLSAMVSEPASLQKPHSIGITINKRDGTPTKVIEKRQEFYLWLVVFHCFCRR